MYVKCFLGGAHYCNLEVLGLSQITGKKKFFFHKWRKELQSLLKFYACTVESEIEWNSLLQFLGVLESTITIWFLGYSTLIIIWFLRYSTLIILCWYMSMLKLMFHQHHQSLIPSIRGWKHVLMLERSN